MNNNQDNQNHFINEQKKRSGFNRLWHATLYSLDGLQAAWHEAAFRLEACIAFVLVPLSFFIGQTWLESAILLGSVLLVLITELLNSGIEAAIDRIGLERHLLSKKAKDLGSAAVLLSVLLCAIVWILALHSWFVNYFKFHYFKINFL